MENFLVTGGAGFIGSNFLEFMVKKYPHKKFINLDKLTYAGDLNNVAILEKSENYHFVKGCITNANFISELFDEYQFHGVYHLAAESHVDNSISNPAAFIETNIVGTFNLLNAAKNLWQDKSHKDKPKFKNARFLHVSTDEVYGSLGETGLFSEETPYAPNSPYSASKASSDFLVRSYFHTYNLNTVTTNCSNNYGPKQHSEKLIPTIIRKALANEPIPVYGDGQNIRDWLFVLDHCKGIDLVFSKGIKGDTYNIGGNNEKRNLEIVKIICETLDIKCPRLKGSYLDLITFVPDRAGHDWRYAIDSNKVETSLGWKAEESFGTGILKTISWYLDREN